MAYPSDCQPGYTYYADSMGSGSVLPAWSGDVSDVIADSGSYRNTFHRTGVDYNKVLRQTITTPTSIEATVGINLAAYHYTDGLDSGGAYLFAGIRVFHSGTSTELFSCGIRYRSSRVYFPAKSYIITLDLMDSYGTVAYSLPILNKSLISSDITYTYTSSYSIKITQVSANVLELFINGSSLGTFTSFYFNFTDTFGIVVGETSYSVGVYQQDFGYVNTFRAVAPSGMGSACDIIPIGLAHGFTSWLSVFQDDSLTGNTFTLPQPLFVDKDDLKFEKEILVK